MYIIVSLATASVLPWQELVSGNPVWATGIAMDASMGSIGVIVLVTGVVMGICSGINGFFLTNSRLLYGMSRAKVLPGWFGKIHPKYNTPTNGVVFTMFFALCAPWFGRNAILWIVDMCGVGTVVSFFYTCVTAYVVMRKEGVEGSGNIHELEHV